MQQRNMEHQWNSGTPRNNGTRTTGQTVQHRRNTSQAPEHYEMQSICSVLKETVNLNLIGALAALFTSLGILSTDSKFLF